MYWPGTSPSDPQLVACLNTLGDIYIYMSIIDLYVSISYIIYIYL